MHHHYADILRLAGLAHEQPRWFDEDGVPRFCDFSPHETANIYAKHAVLLLIACQSCGTEFEVCLTDRMRSEPSLANLVEDDEIHYGDPPNMRCCPAGPTMNSIPIRVLEFWQRYPGDGKRLPEYERAITAGWADDPEILDALDGHGQVDAESRKEQGE